MVLRAIRYWVAFLLGAEVPKLSHVRERGWMHAHELQLERMDMFCFFDFVFVTSGRRLVGTLARSARCFEY